MGNPYRAKSKRATPSPAKSHVPAGTIAEIIRWVGDDKDRAQRALDEENKQEKPRKSLTSQLHEVLDG